MKIKIPYGRQYIDADDVQGVVEVLRSDWLTTGPKVERLEHVFSNFVGSKYSVAVSNGTAALHCAMAAIGIGSGDEVIIPAITFVATANSVVFQGGTPVFADVENDTLLIDVKDVEKKITPRTKAIIAVDYAGQPADYSRLQALASQYKLPIIADACHAIGGSYKGKPVGALADLSTFSFHPVKNITTGEGGMITTNNQNFAKRMYLFRNHGITTDFRQREKQGSWHYEMAEIGYNYRLSDFQCALGISQLKKLPGWVRDRQKIASHYDKSFSNIPGVIPIISKKDINHAYHLYVIKIDPNFMSVDRDSLFTQLRNKGIGVNVHYMPVHYHPFYVKKYNTTPGMCPVAESAYKQILSLPIYPDMSVQDQDFVIKSILDCFE